MTEASSIDLWESLKVAITCLMVGAGIICGIGGGFAFVLWLMKRLKV